jgi:hypothetical protein
MKRREFLQQAMAGAGLLAARDAAGAASLPSGNARAPIRSPLRVHPMNGRYFTDDTGRAIYLTGSHLGWELQDDAWDKQITFDYPRYLDLLSRHGHNLIRMWCVEHTRTDKSTAGVVASPMPFVRSGPGNALDGQPKFDLTRLNEAYFRRLRQRTIAAAERGIYVLVMLFQGWSHRVSKKHRADPWFGNVYNKANNINGIDGDRGVDGRLSHTLGDADLLAVQEAYVRNVIDSVNDLDNVLYEISNESAGTIEWHEHIVGVIHRYERAKGRRHLVMVSGCGGGLTNAELLGCSAEVVGLSGIGNRRYLNNPPAADGKKIVVHDTDHIKPDCRDPAFVWKNFLRGNHPIVLDWDLTDRENDDWEPIRQAMGASHELSERIGLAAMEPAGSLTSSGYCLANRGQAYLVYLPDGGNVEVDLTDAGGTFGAEWINPRSGETVALRKVDGGGKVALDAPFDGSALIYLTARN